MTDGTGVERSVLDRIATLQHDLAGLLAFWHQRGEPESVWVATRQAYTSLARAFIESGAPLLGLEVATEGLEAFPGEVGLRQARGLALARSGNTEAANELLAQLRLEGLVDDETLGTLARTHKDLALGSGAARRTHLNAALQVYTDAYARSGSYWTGINVATLAALQGDGDRSRAVARQVTAECNATLERLPADHADRYWVLATLGEAALVSGEWARAEAWYLQAWELGRRRYGDLASTRRHARILLEHFGRDTAAADRWLRIPRVALFSGHMIDRLDREAARFPADLEPAVHDALRDWLVKQNGLIGFSSAACGADILFLEAIHELGGEAHIVLPYHQNEFVADSVEIAGTGAWRERFDRQLAASRVVYASSSRLRDDGAAFDYANRLVHGLGLVRARELETDLVALAVWNGRTGDGQGGTASAVSQWQRHGIPVHRVRIEAADQGPLAVVAVPPATRERPAVERVRPRHDGVMALLFADVLGFSRLTDAETSLFVTSFLRLVARLVEAAEDPIPVRETWGDGLFLAFSGLRAAGRFALDLLDSLAATDWQMLGFSRPMAMRVALHAGPVHVTTDPVTGRPRCTGCHVNRAARLEPMTPPGHVYASEAFAALAAIEGIEEFRCDYVKELEWAKRYGTFPAYVIRRCSGPSGDRTRQT
jgi:class 3 adenylate cyclase